MARVKNYRSKLINRSPDLLNGTPLGLFREKKGNRTECLRRRISSYDRWNEPQSVSRNTESPSKQTRIVIISSLVSRLPLLTASRLAHYHSRTNGSLLQILASPLVTPNPSYNAGARPRQFYFDSPGAEKERGTVRRRGEGWPGHIIKAAWKQYKTIKGSYRNRAVQPARYCICRREGAGWVELHTRADERR